MCSGSSTSAIKASVKAPVNQQHHPSYDNAACAGSDISTACHPPSLYEESLTSTLTSMVERDQEAAPKPDGQIQSNTISILLASTPSMPPRWSMTDPSGRPLFADCQRSNPIMALKSSKSSFLQEHLRVSPSFLQLHLTTFCRASGACGRTVTLTIPHS